MTQGKSFYILMALLGLSMLALVVRHDHGVILNLENDDFASLMVKIALVVLVGGSVLSIFREDFRNAMHASLFWVVLGLVVAVGYTYRQDLKGAGQKMMAELMPGRAAVMQTVGPEVELVRRKGEFRVETQINAVKIPMVLDTGASAVILTQEAARSIGLPMEVLNYSVQVETANGRTRAAPVTLENIAIGAIRETSVQALIAQPGQLKISLLGMSFLTRLESWQVKGDKLVMRGFP